MRITLLQPPDGKVLSDLAPLAELAARPFAAATAKEGGELIPDREAWPVISLGLFAYRSGHYSRAMEWCRSCLACREDIPVRTGTARLILAMSL